MSWVWPMKARSKNRGSPYGAKAHQFSGVPDTNQTGSVIVHRAENEVVRRDGPETRAVAKCKKPPMISVPGRKTVMGHDGRLIEVDR